MSITYKIEISTSATPQAVMPAILDAATESQLVERYDANGGSLRGGGWFQVDSTEIDPPDPVQEAFGFTPTVEVRFGLNKFGDLNIQEKHVVQLVLGLLERVSGDAVLHFQYEEVLLLRRDGKLTISQRDEIWTPELLALLSPSYERGKLAFN